MNDDTVSEAGVQTLSMEEEMQRRAAHMVLSLRSSPGMTGKAVQRGAENVTSMLETYSAQVKGKTFSQTDS